MGSEQKSVLLQLAQSVLETTKTIVQQLHDTSQEEPSFDQNSPSIQGDANYEASRIELNETALSLVRLVNGPVNEYRRIHLVHYDIAAYQAALELQFFRHVPLDGKISLSDLAHKVGMDEDRCGRIIRLLATQNIFNEVETDYDELHNASTATAQCIKDAPFVSDGTSCPFQTYYGKSTYAWYAENPDKAARFANAMASITQMDQSIAMLCDDFPWGKLGAPGKVVDMGGGSGHVSMHLASHFDNLEFVVQDSNTSALTEGRAKVGADIAPRIKFMHDFFGKQTITDANAFSCVIRALVPALEKCKPGTPLLINDTILPERNEMSKYEEYLSRQVDMCMFVVAGAKERSKKQFEKILKQADSRLEVVKVHGTRTMGLLEVCLRG
ncbi:hypothetical protein FAVG1_02537 [Fusarium avenaceum]|nr:hypothetical protein FAVG1_02537 [Fusarium avenaceum]